MDGWGEAAKDGFSDQEMADIQLSHFGEGGDRLHSVVGQAVACMDLKAQRMAKLVSGYASLHRVRPDAKARALLSWIDHRLRSENNWNGERVIIFTEYKHTLTYLERVLEDAGYSAAIAAVANRSIIASAASRPSRMAQTTNDAPRTISPTA